MAGFAWFNLLLILFIVVVILRYIMKKSRHIFQTKYLYPIVIAYCLLGLASFVYLQFTSDHKITRLSKAEEDALFAESQQVQAYIFSNQLDKVDPAFVKEKKFVTTSEKELQLSTTVETVRGVITYRDDPTSNEIELTVYKLLSTIDGYEVTNYLNPVNFEIVDKTLYVTTQEKSLRIIELYGQVLTVELEGQSRNGFYSINGQHVVHLSVPSHIKIDKDMADFEIFD